MMPLVDEDQAIVVGTKPVTVIEGATTKFWRSTYRMHFKPSVMFPTHFQKQFPAMETNWTHKFRRWAMGSKDNIHMDYLRSAAKL